MIHYTNQIIEFNCVKFKVLDVDKLDFSCAVYGIKKTITKIIKANGGEIIETKNKNGEIESVTVAEFGDAIFCNNQDDKYIPRDSLGNAWKFDKIESYGYRIVETGENCMYIQSNNKALCLVEAINQPTCILNAWGEGNHQFLYSGATLKKDLKTNIVTGIDKSAFDSTWQVLESDLQL